MAHHLPIGFCSAEPDQPLHPESFLRETAVRPTSWWGKLWWAIACHPPASRLSPPIVLEVLESRTTPSVVAPGPFPFTDWLTPALAAPATPGVPVTGTSAESAVAGRPVVLFDPVYVGPPGTPVSPTSQTSHDNSSPSPPPASVVTRLREIYREFVRTGRAPAFDDTPEGQELRDGFALLREVSGQRHPSPTTGPWRERLMTAAVDAYTENDLRMTLDFRMDVSLDHVAPPGRGFQDQVYTLLSWARQHGRLVELATHLAAGRPLRADLAALAAEAVSKAPAAGVIPPQDVS